jgi:ABC-type polysaccharide/polyol phosphate transport system ATPase subunit
MTSDAIVVDRVSKMYRIYHERNQDLKRRILRGRRARFEAFWAVKDLSLTVPHGEVFGVIGSNGSGKSTTLKLLARILTPDEGAIRTDGTVAALLELGAGFHPELTGRENVYLNGALLGISKADLVRRFDDIVGFAGLEQFIDNPIKTYSSGMQVRLGFSVAINVDPDILLVDEVLAVGDEEFQRRCLERIESMRSAGKTIVVVSHGLAMVREMCERVAWIDKGALRAVGSAEEVVDAYQAHAIPPGTAVGAIADAAGRQGAGAVRVEQVSLDDGRGADLVTGGPMTLRIRLSARNDAPDATVSFAVRRADGADLVSSTPAAPIAWDAGGPGAATLAYEVGAVPLGPGEYEATVRVSSGGGTRPIEEDVTTQRFAVRANPDSHDRGVVALLGAWRRESGS